MGLSIETQQSEEQMYLIEAARESGNSFGGERVRLTSLVVRVRDMGDAGTHLQVQIPEQSSSYASRRSDSYARKQASRVLEVLDRKFKKSVLVQ